MTMRAVIIFTIDAGGSGICASFSNRTFPVSDSTKMAEV
jgi:hypothetical protein